MTGSSSFCRKAGGAASGCSGATDVELRARLPRLPRGRPRLRPRNRLAVKLLALLAFLCPGIVAANAGNDAGGIATYSSVGARYGYDLLWMMVLITVSLVVVQEMAARM